MSINRIGKLLLLFKLLSMRNSSCLTSSLLSWYVFNLSINPLKAELNPIRHLLELVGAHHFVEVSRIRVKNPKLASLYSKMWHEFNEITASEQEQLQ
jgi:hypothetical protein